MDYLTGIAGKEKKWNRKIIKALKREKEVSLKIHKHAHSETIKYRQRVPFAHEESFDLL